MLTLATKYVWWAACPSRCIREVISVAIGYQKVPTELLEVLQATMSAIIVPGLSVASHAALDVEENCT